MRTPEPLINGNVDPRVEANLRLFIRRVAVFLNDGVGEDASGFTGTFYAALTSGGPVTALVTVANGLVVSVSAPVVLGTPGGWQFNDAANSSHALMATFD